MTVNKPNVSSTSDVLIIGGSHAGLSAALTLYRALHTSIIFDSKKPRNQYSTPLRLTSTWEHRPFEDMLEASRKELADAGFTKFVFAGVDKLEKLENDVFQITDDGGKRWLGRKVLFATGSQDVFPDVEGYGDLYAKGIFACMFQFGFELRGSASAGLLAIDGLASAFQATVLAKDGFKFVEKMTIYTNANPDLASRISSTVATPGIAVDDRKIKCLNRGDNSTSDVMIHFEDGSSKTEAFLVHRPLTKMDTRLVEQIGVKMSKMGDIEAAPPFFKTNISGVFAAGDCATPMKTIPNAMMMGAYAGCGIARELPKVV